MSRRKQKNAFGHGLVEGTQMGPVISQVQLERVTGLY